ncbi:GAF domain-containing protein [Limosilactobacillus panis]|uniref:GAF domain-containing protein n=1 Tax=Limosilactobacillus panis TaxID=47493 RepID=UPI001C97B37A|nr:GAF domain-containing protein [Limosilactobacillus panis]QZN93623.1 GAF domain-containing protein [Limosilactobacillus panis]
MTDFKLILQQLSALLAGEHQSITVMANTSALVNQVVSQLNWVGFYLYDHDKDDLFLGPFQGNVACMHIKPGHGVCGTAAQHRHMVNVEDVSRFPGYISCDADSQSELVVPLVMDGKLIGVFDIDAPVKGRFDDDLTKFLIDVAAIVVKSID